MKVIRVILAIYIAVLAVYPCSDTGTHADELRNEKMTASISNHAHADEERDICTPFCICSCCAAHIRLSSISDIDFAGVIHNTKPTMHYIERQALSDYNHIWQPPKI